MMNTGRVPLGEVVMFARRSVNPEDIDLDSDYVLLEHITACTGEVTPIRAGDTSIKSSKYAFQSGDILYGKLRPNLRKACVVERPGYCSTDILPLRPKHTNSSFFLSSVLRSEPFYLEVERLIGGASLPRVKPKELLELEVPWLNGVDRKKFDELARIAAELRKDVATFSGRVEVFERALWSS